MIVILFMAPMLARASDLSASTLSMACALGDTESVRVMLEQGADPNEPDEEGYTPLLRAVFAGVSRPLSSHYEIVKLLADAGANVNASADIFPDESVGTVGALHRTVTEGAEFLDLTLLLLEKGADPNLPGAFGSPLHAAAASDKAEADEVKLLLEWGADAKGLSQWGIEPLVEAVTARSPSPGKIALLAEAGSNLDARFDWNGHHAVNALMALAMNGSPETIETLLSLGAYKYAESGDGLTAYDYALLAERMENARILR